MSYSVQTVNDWKHGGGCGGEEDDDDHDDRYHDQNTLFSGEDFSSCKQAGPSRQLRFYSAWTR